MWLFDRLIVAPQRSTPRWTRACAARSRTRRSTRFFKGLPKRAGAERVGRRTLEDALRFLRECLDDAMQAACASSCPNSSAASSSRASRATSSSSSRDEARVALAARAAPLRGLVRLRALGAGAAARSRPRRLLRSPGRSTGSTSTRSARAGSSQDYKSGKTAHSAAQIEREQQLQIPLYMLVLRDLVGIEPLGGVYRALAGERQARGLLRAEAREDGVPGFQRTTTSTRTRSGGRSSARASGAHAVVARIRAGDVQHDPKGGCPCPSWCDLWPMCRVKRS